MNILVTGANGQLGKSLRDVASNTPDNYFFTDLAELDITDRHAVKKMAEDFKIDVIVNCAAYTNVDGAEEDYDFAELLNSTAVRNLADAMKERNGWLIHISTDYVFGGGNANTPRAEDATLNPTGVYGLTKLHGEEEVAKSGVNALIFRTSWLYSEYGKNFVKTMLILTDEKPELKVVFDQCGTPTYARDLALAIKEIIEKRQLEGKAGIYHFSNEGVCSWFDFATMIAKMASHDNCNVKPCHSSEFPSKVVRPPYSVLDKTKFKETFKRTIPYWTDSLKTCLNNLSIN